MNRIFGFPEIVRFSWSSCFRILDESAVSVDWNEPINEDESTYNKKRNVSAVSSNQTTLKQFSAEKKEKNYLFAYKCKSISEI